MSFIDTPDFPGAETAPNYQKLLMTRPRVLAAWDNLLNIIKETQDFRTYELATLAAAKQVKSSYCVLAHSTALCSNEAISMEDIAEIVSDGGSEKLSEREKGVMEFAAKVARCPDQVTQSDVDGLRELGLGDSEVFDIAATAAARCFLTRLVDSLGAQPDSHFAALPESVKEKMVVGRPIEGT